MSAAVRPVATRLANPLLLFVDARKPAPKGSTSASGVSTAPLLVKALPPQLEILTLLMLPPNSNVTYGMNDTTAGDETPIASSVLLLRLRHIYASGDGTGANSTLGLGKAVDIDLSSLL